MVDAGDVGGRGEAGGLPAAEPASAGKEIFTETGVKGEEGELPAA